MFKLPNLVAMNWKRYEIHNVYIICAFASIGGGLFGFDISSISAVIATEAYTNYFHVNGGSMQGIITCAMPLGSFFGALGSSFFADRLGRKITIQMAAIIFLVGASLQASANGIALLIVGRIIAGLCVGICSTVVPVYQAEIAPKEIRGRVVSLQQWAITWGILIQYFVQYGASFSEGGPKDPNQGTAAFRIPWAVQMVPAAVLFVGMFFFPNSPRWLATQDRWEEAIKVLAVLHGGGDINHPKVLAQYQEIEEALGAERIEGKSDFRVMIQPKIAKRVFLGMSIQMWSQLCGINVMMYYVVYIMESAGIGDSLLAASIQYILNVVMTIPAILFLDKWGRRPILLLGSFAMMVFMFSVGALEAVYGHEQHSDSGPLAAITWVLKDNTAGVAHAIVALTYLFVIAFAMTWGPVSWTYPSEIFPSQVRAKAVSLSTASNWGWNTGIAYAVPPLLWAVNWKVYMLFGTFNALAMLHMFVAAPETKGKTLEEMDEVFDAAVPAWRSHHIESRLDRLARDIANGRTKVVGPGGTYLGVQKPTAVHLDLTNPPWASIFGDDTFSRKDLERLRS